MSDTRPGAGSSHKSPTSVIQGYASVKYPTMAGSVVVVVVVAAAIGEVVVEAGSTCGSPGTRGIEARRRAWVDRFSSAPWVLIPLLAIKFSVRGAPCPHFLVSSHPFDWIEWALTIATQRRARVDGVLLLSLLMLTSILTT